MQDWKVLCSPFCLATHYFSNQVLNPQQIRENPQQHYLLNPKISIITANKPPFLYQITPIAPQEHISISECLPALRRDTFPFQNTFLRFAGSHFHFQIPSCASQGDIPISEWLPAERLAKLEQKFNANQDAYCLN